MLKPAQHVMQDRLTGCLLTQAGDLPSCAATTERAAIDRIEDVVLNQSQRVAGRHISSLRRNKNPHEVVT